MKSKLKKSKDYTVRNGSLIVLAGLAWVGFSDLVSAGTNLAVVYGLGLILIGTLLNNVWSK